MEAILNKILMYGMYRLIVNILINILKQRDFFLVIFGIYYRDVSREASLKY